MAGYQAHVAKPYEPSEVAALVAHLAGVASVSRDSDSRVTHHDHDS
jgi:hypothetical protein